MTTVFEVKTIHTKKVLYDFVKFTQQIKHSSVSIRFYILTASFLGLAYIARNSGNIKWVMLGIAALFLVFNLTRMRIGAARLAAVDKNYRNKSVITFTFGESEFHVENPDEAQIDKVKYGEITAGYADKTYYYLSLNNEDLHMLPRADFTVGNEEEFKEFIEHKSGQDFMPVKLPFKVRYEMAKIRQQEQEAKRMAEYEERKREKEARKKNKK
ncbi:MAG: YcxB family protein [Lachnospiraceae bacterium]|jgi:hypothetical protein|nr:YcxB family protein [Lachnospiraceae bacterium]